MIPIIDVGLKIIEKLIPDKAAREKAQLDLIKLQQEGHFKEMDAQLQRDLGQMEVNRAEAASGNQFASSWRPLCGYVCVLGLAYQFVVCPLLGWGSGIADWPLPPKLDMGDLITILGGMLGLGALRTSEKFRGVAR